MAAEPWIIRHIAPDAFEVLDANGLQMLAFLRDAESDEQWADLVKCVEHIVKCVNACAGKNV